mmetsp:Transcript_7507/g.24058  ORF Transcript_7507/g.24058 Transcript_7507/m.24058 type:complete len:350 (+) Transcript_7507:27-1076(+)
MRVAGTSNWREACESRRRQRRGHLGKVEAVQPACEQRLLGQLFVVAPLDGERDVHVQLVQRGQVHVHALLGEVCEAEGVDPDLKVAVRAAERRGRRRQRARLRQEDGLAVILLDRGAELAEIAQVVHLDDQLETLLERQVAARRLLHPPPEERIAGAVAVAPRAQALHRGAEVEDELVALASRVAAAAPHERGRLLRNRAADHESARQPRVVLHVGVRAARQPHARANPRCDPLALEHVRREERVDVRRRRRLLLVLLVVGTGAQRKLRAVAVAPPRLARRGAAQGPTQTEAARREPPRQRARVQGIGIGICVCVGGGASSASSGKIDHCWRWGTDCNPEDESDAEHRL